MSFFVHVGVTLCHGVAGGISGEGQAVVFIAQGPFGALHIGIASVVGANCGGAECGDVAVVGQVLVNHRDVVRCQRAGAVGGVSGERLEHPNASAGSGSTAEFGGVEQLSLRSNPSAVEQPTLVEQIGALEKEGTIFIELNFF